MEFIMTRDSLDKIDLEGKHYLYAGLDVILEEINRNGDLPDVLCQALQDGISWQIRAEMTVQRSILSPGSTFPWIAMLMALGAILIYPDGAKKALPEYMKQRTNATGIPNGLLIPLDLNSAKICYQAVRPTPAGLPTVSVCTFLDMKNNQIQDARIALTGTWRNKLGLVKCAHQLIGKTLTEAVIQDIVKSILDEITPVSNFQASETYRREMAKCLVERSLHSCMPQGEVTQ